MTEPTTTTVVEPTTQSRWRRLNKAKVAKVGAAIGGTVLGAVYLKRKLNCTCAVDADVHVETADQSDN